MRDRSQEIRMRAAKIVAEKRQQNEDLKRRQERGIDRLANFLKKVEEVGIIKILRDYPQIRVHDTAHGFSIGYKGLDYAVLVDTNTGNLYREMSFENEPGRARSHGFDDERAMDDMVEYLAIMIAKIEMGE